MKPYGIIYLITNKVNGKKYVGQTTKTIQERFSEHIRYAKHISNKTIHKAMRNHGLDNFSVIQLCECNNQNELNKMEQYYILEYETIFDHHKGYNMTYGGNQNGKLSEKTKEKISKSLKGENHQYYGKHLSEEHRRKISEANKGKKCKHLTEEHKRKISKSKKGGKLSEETKRNMSEAHKGKIFSEEHKRRLSEAGMGHVVTEETRRRVSETQKGNKNMLGKHHTDETRQKMSKSQKKRREREITLPLPMTKL